MTWLAILAGVIAVAVVGAEVAGRYAGLHRPLVYERTEYGYRIRPGQEARLLSRRAAYDGQGLRSRPFAGPPTDGQVRILCIGDSITNGGLRVDQAGTWPALLETILRGRGIDAHVLNASAGGWALENAAGWFARHGSFESQIVVFEVGTHDLWQERASEALVGNHPAFPDRAPAFALQAALVRYVWPRVFGAGTADPGTTGAEPTARDIDARLSVLKTMVEQARRQGALPIVLHIEQPAPFEVSTPLVVDAKRKLRDWTAGAGIAYVNPRGPIERAGGSALFFDPYHPNEAGNKVIASELAGQLGALR